MDVIKLADEIINGRRLSRDEDLSFLKTCDVDKLSQGADKLRKHFNGDNVDMCAIISGKSGNCSENCKFCAQSAHNHTGCDIHEMLDYAEVCATAKTYEDNGVDRFAIVNSGHGPKDSDFDKIVNIYEKLNSELNISLCSSLGFLSDEQFKRLYEAGVRSYHNNIETSRNYFSKICTSHSFDDKIANIRRAQNAGFNVCSGGIIGMGETMDDRLEMAFDLAELGIKSIPINALIPVSGTPMEKLDTLSEDEILRTIACFKYINPESDIRLAAGRKLISDNGKKAFNGGISSTITGNMLTTTGSTIEGDRQMLKAMNRLIKN
ncbi:MAG: biotin synthase BioB [Eubacterium sp.]|nr:biotin synthase BioB [Eubacterium sp.]